VHASLSGLACAFTIMKGKIVRVKPMKFQSGLQGPLFCYRELIQNDVLIPELSLGHFFQKEHSAFHYHRFVVIDDTFYHPKMQAYE